MDAQELCNLQEAYMNVYENEQLDEGMTIADYKKQKSAQKQKEKRAADKIAPTRRAGIHNPEKTPETAARHRANVDPDFEGDDERNYPGGKLRPNKVRKAKALGELGEQVDIYDIILSHLLDEGYAETPEAAEAIMVNMSEDWRQSICEEKYKTYVVDIDPKEVEKVYQRKMQAERERKFAKRMAKQSVKDSTREN
jgi:hypothetical protein